MSSKIYEIKRNKLKLKTQNVSEEVQQIAQGMSSLKTHQLHELMEVVQHDLECREEFNKLSPGFIDEPDLIGSLQIHQAVNYLLSFLESKDGDPDIDWAPATECWGCGADNRAPNSLYCSFDCSESLRNWRKHARNKANKVDIKQVDKRREILMEMIAKRLKSRPFGEYVPTLNFNNNDELGEGDYGKK